MIDRINLVQNDTGPQLLMTLRDKNTGDTLDLSGIGTEVYFHLSLGSDLPAKAIIPMIPGPNAANGQVMLDWAAGDTSALDTVGNCYGEVQITWPNGRIQTAPDRLRFRIRKELA